MAGYALGALPFAPTQLYDRSGEDRIAELMLRQGQNRANATAASGALWANTIADIGKNVGNQITANREIKRREASDRAENALKARELEQRDKEALQRAEEWKFKAAAARDEYLGSLAAGVEPHLGDPDGGAQAAVFALEHAKDILGEQTTAGIMQQIKSDPAHLAALIKELKQRSPSMREQMAKEADRNKPIEVSPGATLYDPAKGKDVFTAPNKPAAAPNLQHVETSKGIQSFNPETGQLGPVIAQPKPPTVAPKEPSYTPKVVMVDGKPVQANYDSKTGKYHDPDTGAVLKGVNAKLGSTEQNKLDMAQTVAEVGNELITEMSDPAVIATIGPAMGRYNTLREFVGNPPPEFSELAGKIESYSLASMGVHGMRSVQGAEKIKALLDKKQTPQSMAAAIRGLNSFAESYVENKIGKQDDKAPEKKRLVYDPATGEFK